MVRKTQLVFPIPCNLNDVRPEIGISVCWTEKWGGEGWTIEFSLRVEIENRPHQIYDPVHGKVGITHWEKVAVEEDLTRVEFLPITGRIHQLRSHSAYARGLGILIVRVSALWPRDGHRPTQTPLCRVGVSASAKRGRGDFLLQPILLAPESYLASWFSGPSLVLSKRSGQRKFVALASVLPSSSPSEKQPGGRQRDCRTQ